MADDAYDERFEQFEDMVRRLTAMLVEQRTFNQQIAGLLQEQREFNRRQVEINDRLEITQARIETLVARMLPTGENGREA